MSKNQDILEAHVKFEMAFWREAGPREELQALWNWLNETKTGDVLSKDDVLQGIRRIVLERPAGELSQGLGRNLSETLHKVLGETQAKPEDIIPKEKFNELVLTAFKLKELRGEIVHDIFNSPTYARMISDILFNAIKEFLEEANDIAGKIPGASTFLKLGQDLVKNISSMTGLDSEIENKVRDFIKGNIKHTVARSEKLLNEELDKDLPREIIDELWENHAHKPVGDLKNLIKLENVHEIQGKADSFWEELRKSTVFASLLESVGTGLHEQLAPKTLGAILQENGVTQDEFLNNGAELLGSLFQKEAVSAFVESRIRARLGAFYDSPEGKSVLG